MRMSHERRGAAQIFSRQGRFLRAVFAGVAAFAASAAWGEAAPEAPAADVPVREWADVPAPAWRRLVAGKTVVYERFGQIHGYETYPTEGDAVYWRDPSGQCFTGSWRTLGAAPVYCFDWTDPSLGAAGAGGSWCGRHLRQGDALAAMSVVDLDGTLNAQDEPHRVRAILDKQSPCPPKSLS